ncbi:MAG: hypothetical protein JRI25_26040 [Deltaproteobacteria bacterium]|nr:hypothetical protein [Deltaproteobacteria bacterium]MBW2258042.1 hypothetical protein [Deltaproteobacteria bacterium]
MARDLARDAALDLAWSLWTELGVPGPRRSHQRAILDPERLIVVTPSICRDDARLADLAFSWCTGHAHRISGSRLKGLLRSAHHDVRIAAEAFLGELATEGIHLVRVPPVSPARPRDRRDVAVQIERPALLRLRVRALLGLSGRADVLVALLSSPDTWIRAAALEDVGIAKRNVARILAELAEGGIARSRRRGNVREFRLSNPTAFGTVVALPRDAVFPDWPAIFEWMRLADELASLPAGRPATLRVEVARRRESLEGLAATLGFPRHESVALSDPEPLVAWVVATACAIADGTAHPVAGPAGRHRFTAA